jgi:hypothetical protein
MDSLSLAVKGIRSSSKDYAKIRSLDVLMIRDSTGWRRESRLFLLESTNEFANAVNLDSKTDDFKRFSANISEQTMSAWMRRDKP